MPAYMWLCGYACMRVCVYVNITYNTNLISYEAVIVLLFPCLSKGEFQEHVTLSYLMTCGSRLNTHFLPRQRGVRHRSFYRTRRKAPVQYAGISRQLCNTTI
ncbi:hypothetical protein NP493_974g00047 [Ridgeia piscesae]|uniref:Uncharacterized protein n=1 Tax=Ridgeia piscesae TaxID=27915 RepID=A0AAD9NL58_RIDPI|nr:hypothetical protein NP493_974g00047 [Ridgeia piscesae]